MCCVPNLFLEQLKMLKWVLSHLHWCDLDVLHNLFLKQLKKLKWIFTHLHWCDLDVLHNLFLKQLKKLKWVFTHLQLILRSWKALDVKHILEESQATVKLQPDGVLHSVSQAAEEAQIGPCLSLLALLAKKQRTQVLDPPQIQSPQISPLLASGRSRNDNRFPSSSVTQIDAAWWLLRFCSRSCCTLRGRSFCRFPVWSRSSPLLLPLPPSQFVSCTSLWTRALLPDWVQEIRKKKLSKICGEVWRKWWREREREREREVIFTMDCCCCCCRRQVLWECGGQQQSSSWILISPPSSTRRRSLSSHTLQRSSSLLSSSSSSALTICTDFQTRISVRRSRRRRKKQHCGGDGAAAAPPPVRKSLGPYSDYSNSNNSSRNVPDTSESL